MATKKILLIDDDVELCDLLSEYFGSEGFTVACAHAGSDGMKELFSRGADIIILDVMLPERSGLSVLQEIRSRTNVPVIMLTAKGDHADRVAGLETGADDYITKPFSTRELAARVRAVLRRTEGSGLAIDERIRVADVELDLMSRAVTVGGSSVSLTNAEFQLLSALLRSVGRVVSLDTLSMEVLKRPYSTFDRSLSVHMSNLRRKIGLYPSGDDRITTVRSEGFIYILPKSPQDNGRR